MQEPRAANDESLNRVGWRLRTLHQCTHTLFQAGTEQELLQTICDILAADGEVRLAWIGYSENDAAETVRPVAQAGAGFDVLEPHTRSSREVETDQNPASIAIRTGEPCRVDDIRTDPKCAHWRLAALARGYASCVAVPLVADGTLRGRLDLRGTLNLFSAGRNAFDESATEYYASLATSVTYAVTALRGHLVEDLTHGVTAVRSSEERKRARQALEDLAGRLINAQEEERSRIGRELHDHISQRLGFLAIKIDELRANASMGPTALSEALDNLRQDTIEVAADVHRLSHRLHSSMLDYLGLMPAMRRLVDEFSERHSIAIDLAATSLPTLRPDVALCLFRVAEEGLTNIAKHSGARSARLRVAGAASGVRLTIEDMGSGFDPNLPESQAGLGFVSMRERLRLVQGTMDVRSVPSQGTRIDVWVPITP